MPQLIRYGQTVGSFFDLFGSYENDMTDALAFTLSRSGHFLRLFLANLGYARSSSPEDVVLSLQTRRPKEGITDLEIQVADAFFGILEAKRGSTLPGETQLRCYASVLAGRTAATKVLVAVTNATPAFAKGMLPALRHPKVPITHRSWRQIRDLAIRARPNETHEAKRILDYYLKYLEVILGMERRFDNRVYVVSLGKGNPEGWSLSWIDIVEKRRRYFYPVGTRWPDPPNYLAFRYYGKLQSIHHVRSYEILTNFHDVFPEAPDEPTGDPLYCFKLGPPIRPPREVRAGPRVRRNNRVWCVLDTLLTARTISDALTETKRRQEA